MNELGVQSIGLNNADTMPRISFGHMEVSSKPNAFMDAIGSLNQTMIEAEDNMVSYVLDSNSISVHELMISIENAKMSMKVAVELRNKIAESYKEILNMQI